MENHCPQCQKDLTEIENKVTLNIINLAHLDVQISHQYCSSQCIETKVRCAPKESGEFFPFVIQEDLIKVFGKDKNDNYFIVVDL